jgi:Flp pilus assembly protein TadG
MQMSFIRTPLRRFARDTKGSVVLEAIIAVPLLVSVYLMLFVFWDAYRSINTVQKASYTISDMISRAPADLPESYITGMRTTMNFMLPGDQTAQIRVTSFVWSGVRSRYEVLFSRSPGNALPRLTTATIAGYVNRLPIMVDGEAAVLVETVVPYTPPLNQLQALTLGEFIVTRPRFVPKVCLINLPNNCNA